MLKLRIRVPAARRRVVTIVPPVLLEADRVVGPPAVVRVALHRHEAVVHLHRAQRDAVARARERDRRLRLYAPLPRDEAQVRLLHVGAGHGVHVVGHRVRAARAGVVGGAVMGIS